jgi:hypothetical protein
MRAAIFFSPVERSDLLQKFGLSSDQGQQTGAYLQVCPVGQPILPWDRAEEKSKMYLPPAALLETLRFFGRFDSRWPHLEAHLHKVLGKLKKSGRASANGGNMVIEGDSTLWFREGLFNGLDFGLPSYSLVVRASPRNASLPLRACLASTDGGRLEVPIPLLVQLGQNYDFLFRVSQNLPPFDLDNLFSSPARAAGSLLENAMSQIFGNEPADLTSAAACTAAGQEEEEYVPQNVQSQVVDFQVNLLDPSAFLPVAQQAGESEGPAFPHLEAAAEEASCEAAASRSGDKRSSPRSASFRAYRNYSTSSDRGYQTSSDRGPQTSSDRGYLTSSDRGLQTSSDRGLQTSSDRGPQTSSSAARGYKSGSSSKRPRH